MDKILNKPILFYDAKNKILGRLASVIAKELIKGQKVVVFNVKFVLQTGTLTFLKNKYLTLLDVGTERKGPFFKRSAQGYFKKAIGGMLPIAKGPGKQYLKNLTIYENEITPLNPPVEYTNQIKKAIPIHKITVAIRGKQNKI
jgi:large subunit ribosomal protein L13